MSLAFVQILDERKRKKSQTNEYEQEYAWDRRSTHMLVRSIRMVVAKK